MSVKQILKWLTAVLKPLFNKLLIFSGKFDVGKSFRAWQLIACVWVWASRAFNNLQLYLDQTGGTVADCSHFGIACQVSP